ncbi:MAG: nucleotidyltransferase family protein [Campylobacterota bacterium]
MPINNKLLKLNDKLKFLIACSQTDPSEEDIEFIHSTLDSEHLTSNALISLANQHGILPLVYKTIKNLPHIAHHTHEDFLTDLKSAYRQISQQNMLMSAELIRVMKLFEENNIEALAFKGPALSQMAYGDITLRQYNDLDVLIKQEDRDKISKILESQGYEQVLMLTSVQEKNWYKHVKDMSLFHLQKGIHIELHWLLLDNDYPIQVDLSSIWEYPQSVVINRQKVQTFPNESLLLYLCIHGSKHLWERIEWIKDIDLIIRTQTIDWELVAEQVNKSGFERMFLLGLYLSNTLFQTPLPTIFIQQMKHQKWLIKLSDFVINDWKQHRGMFHNSLAMRHLFPRIKMQLHYLYQIILKPSKNEYRFVDLPKGLYWVYYLIRPYLLIKKYITKN